MEFTPVSPVSTLLIAVFLSTVTNRLVAAFVKPLWTKFSLDPFWLLYISWLIGGALAWLAGINLVAVYIPDPLAGRILTAVVVGGGANLIHDLFDLKPDSGSTNDRSYKG